MELYGDGAGASRDHNVSPVDGQLLVAPPVDVNPATQPAGKGAQRSPGFPGTTQIAHYPMTGYMVIPGALDVVASGIQSVLDEMTSLGINGEQESGGPIEDAALSTEDLGCEAMAAILADALQRAHYALRTALANGQNVVSLLRTTEASCQDTEQQIGGMFDQIVHDLGTAGRATKTPATTRATRRSTGVLDRLAGAG